MNARTLSTGLLAGWRAATGWGHRLGRPTLVQDDHALRGFLLNSQLSMSFLPRSAGSPSDARSEQRDA